jgi:hypothetical protein
MGTPIRPATDKTLTIYAPFFYLISFGRSPLINAIGERQLTFMRCLATLKSQLRNSSL